MNTVFCKSKRALFVCYGGGHIASCLPIASELVARGWSVHLVALTTAFKYAQDRGWSPLGFKDFIEEEDRKEIRECGFSFEGEVSGLISSEESAAYLGLSYLDLIKENGKEKASQLYASGGRQIFFPLKTMSKILKIINPDILITTASPRAEYAAQIAASELGIKRICFLDLPDEYMMQRVYGMPGGVELCVADGYIREKMIEIGFPSDSLHVTGNPAFDELREVKACDIEAIKERVQFSSGVKVILWASQIEPEKDPVTGEIADSELPRKIEKALRKMVSNREDLRLIVRYHPNEDQEFLEEKNVYLSPKGEDINVLLNSCDVIVTMTSTVAFQAAYLRKPVVSVDISVFSKTLKLSDIGVSRGVVDIKDISLVVEEVLTAQKESLDMCDVEVMKSAEKIADVAETML